MQANNDKLDFIGKLAKTFIQSKLTLVISIASLLLGLMAVYLTPKEEEPQISVPMIDIQLAAPGFEAAEVERKVTEVVERAVWGLDGVEYVYSTSRPHGALVTVRFKVGEPIEPSLVKVHHKLMTVKNELPSNVLNPEVKSYSIDDVPFLVLSFSSNKQDDYNLRQWIAPLARELSSTAELSRTELLGGLSRTIRVIADPVQLNQHGVSLLALAESLKQNHLTLPAGKIWPTDDNTSDQKTYDIEINGRVETPEQLENIAVGVRGGQVIRVKDVAKVIDGPEQRTRQSILLQKNNGQIEKSNAVSLVFSKRKGTNVVSLANTLMKRVDTFRKDLPADIQMTETRNYGKTAADKSNELIEHLLIATISVSVLIALFMGIRAALVVAIAIPVTLALTLAIYYFMGYTLNRVTLFALIFSIGILVDDAIVVVENIERHLKNFTDKTGSATNAKMKLVKATIAAVSEVGNPTVLATFTVIAAILPMAFVRGLMGPYMKPIPVGASLAMILSLFVAFVVTPWAAVKLLKHDHNHHSNNDNSDGSHSSPEKEGALDRGYRHLMETFLENKWASLGLGAVTVALLVISMSFVYFKSVKVKMLPFDNKNEFQVLLDYDPNVSLQDSIKQTEILAAEILKNENVINVQIFAGEAAPFSFSGMVKHTFMRKSDYQNDLQIVLKDKGQRHQSSHEVIESLRPLIKKFSLDHQVVSKVLEIPPGPPVLATMLAEVYGPNKEARQEAVSKIEAIFKSENSFVDVDTTFRADRSRKIYDYDQIKGGDLGGRSQNLAMLGNLVFSETNLFSLNLQDRKKDGTKLSDDSLPPEEIQVRLSLKNSDRTSATPFKNLTVPSFESGTMAAESVLKKPRIVSTENLYRKNLKPVSYVMSELSGSEEAPVYGMLKIADKIPYESQTAEVPWDTQKPVIKWDGEWFITYEVFRDLGGAFAVVMILIYILVLGWFKSFTVPLIIMAPIPISLIGIIPGHWVTGAYFTATSMIGFIAGAGIIVRNSIILVDFIEHQLQQGMGLKLAVVSAGVLRFRPMILTAAAVVVGSAVMIFDPIFQGLAVSLMFGEVAATLISRLTVPVLYYWFVGKQRQAIIQTINPEV